MFFLEKALDDIEYAISLDDFSLSAKLEEYEELDSEQRLAAFSEHSNNHHLLFLCKKGKVEEAHSQAIEKLNKIKEIS